MNDIDILEDYIELIEKGYCEDCNELCNISTTPVYPSKAVAQAISTLIAENKELKEENEGLKTKLDTLIEKYKELKEMLKHRIEYTNKLEKDLFQNASNYVIPKSKVEMEIHDIDNWLEGGRYIHYGLNPYELEAQKKVLQSLLGEE